MTTNGLTYEGRKWNELTDKQKEVSIKRCLVGLRTGHSVFTCVYTRWFLVHSTEIKMSRLRAIINEVREASPEELDISTLIR